MLYYKATFLSSVRIDEQGLRLSRTSLDCSNGRTGACRDPQGTAATMTRSRYLT